MAPSRCCPQMENKRLLGNQHQQTSRQAKIPSQGKFAFRVGDYSVAVGHYTAAAILQCVSQKCRVWANAGPNGSRSTLACQGLSAAAVVCSQPSTWRVWRISNEPNIGIPLSGNSPFSRTPQMFPSLSTVTDYISFYKLTWLVDVEHWFGVRSTKSFGLISRSLVAEHIYRVSKLTISYPRRVENSLQLTPADGRFDPRK